METGWLANLMRTTNKPGGLLGLVLPFHLRHQVAVQGRRTSLCGCHGLVFVFLKLKRNGTVATPFSEVGPKKLWSLMHVQIDSLAVKQMEWGSASVFVSREAVPCGFLA